MGSCVSLLTGVAVQGSGSGGLAADVKVPSAPCPAGDLSCEYATIQSLPACWDGNGHGTHVMGIAGGSFHGERGKG